jgi:nitroalkane oxidase
LGEEVRELEHLIGGSHPMAIEFTPTPEQVDLRDMARSFAERVLRPLASDLEKLTDPWECFQRTRPAFAEMAKAGFTAGFIPTEYGGAGFGCIEFALAAEELTRVEVGVPTTLLGHGLALQPVIQFGTPEQKERFLRPFTEDATGDRLACFAFTEASGGANFDSDDPEAGVVTYAQRDGDYYVINGTKHFATNGSGWDRKGAHLYTVTVRTDRNAGAKEGLSVIVVPGDTPGIRVGRIEDKVGHRLTVQPEVVFENVRVPVANLLGSEGDGIPIIVGAFNWTAALIGAACVGTARTAFDYALEFAKSGKRLGSVPIIYHQAVGYALADIKMRIEACRYLTWRACAYLDSHADGRAEVANIAKVYCSEQAVKCVYDAMQIVGVESYTKDHPLERLLRDALVFPLYDGGNMGVRRRQLHGILCSPGYDSGLIAEDRELPFSKDMSGTLGLRHSAQNEIPGPAR